jgi:hypothetical protein
MGNSSDTGKSANNVGAAADLGDVEFRLNNRDSQLMGTTSYNRLGETFLQRCISTLRQ